MSRDTNWAGSSPEVRDVLDRAYAQGYEIRRSGNGHWKIIITGERREWLLDNGFEFDPRASHFVPLSSTPKDKNAVRNAMKYLKRIGLDFEPAKSEKEEVVEVETPVKNGVPIAEEVAEPVEPPAPVKPAKRTKRDTGISSDIVLEGLQGYGDKGATVHQLAHEVICPLLGEDSGFGYQQITDAINHQLKNLLQAGSIAKGANERREYMHRSVPVWSAVAVPEDSTTDLETPSFERTTDVTPEVEPEPTHREKLEKVLDENRKLYNDQVEGALEAISTLLQLPIHMLEVPEIREEIDRLRVIFFGLE